MCLEHSLENKIHYVPPVSCLAKLTTRRALTFALEKRTKLEKREGGPQNGQGVQLLIPPGERRPTVSRSGWRWMETVHWVVSVTTESVTGEGCWVSPSLRFRWECLIERGWRTKKQLCTESSSVFNVEIKAHGVKHALSLGCNDKLSCPIRSCVFIFLTTLSEPGLPPCQFCPPVM